MFKLSAVTSETTKKKARKSRINKISIFKQSFNGGGKNIENLSQERVNARRSQSTEGLNQGNGNRFKSFQHKETKEKKVSSRRDLSPRENEPDESYNKELEWS